MIEVQEEEWKALKETMEKLSKISEYETAKIQYMITRLSHLSKLLSTRKRITRKLMEDWLGQTLEVLYNISQKEQEDLGLPKF